MFNARSIPVGGDQRRIRDHKPRTRSGASERQTEVKKKKENKDQSTMQGYEIPHEEARWTWKVQRSYLGMTGVDG
jgi:hypothetical protein